MSRFLFVVPPLAERVRPTVAVGRELRERGHPVAWAGHPDVLAGLVPAGATILDALAAAEDDAVGLAAARPSKGLRSPAALILLWDDYLLPLARSMLAGVSEAVDEFAPDVLVVDQQALAGAVVARLSGLPWATTVPTSAGLADPLRDLPRIARRTRRQVREFLCEAGLDDVSAVHFEPRASAQLVLAFSTRAMAGDPDPPSARHAFVGPCLDRSALGTIAPVGPVESGRSAIVVAVDAPHEAPGADLCAAAAEVLPQWGLEVVVAADPAPWADPPPGVAVAPVASIGALVRRAAVVVCDGGYATVCAALAHGVPLVVAPGGNDQPVIADQVVRAAGAVRVAAGPSPALELRRAVETALTDPRIRSGAQRIGESFSRAGGAASAADHLEGLAAG